MTEAKTSPRRVEAALKQATALEMRLAGQTYQEIAGTVGWKTPQGANMAVKAALAKTLKPPADEWRALNIWGPMEGWENE